MQRFLDDAAFLFGSVSFLLAFQTLEGSVCVINSLVTAGIGCQGQHGSDKEEAETLLDLHKQYIRLYYSCIAKRLGVDASYINRVANGEHQSERLRRALLSELGLMQAAA